MPCGRWQGAVRHGLTLRLACWRRFEPFPLAGQCPPVPPEFRLQPLQVRHAVNPAIAADNLANVPVNSDRVAIVFPQRLLNLVADHGIPALAFAPDDSLHGLAIGIRIAAPPT